MRRSWALFALVLAACSAGSGASSCIEEAIGKSKSQSIDDHTWQQGSRQLPSLTPPLGYSSWDDRIVADEPRAAIACLNESILYASFKVIGGAVFRRKGPPNTPYLDVVTDLTLLSTWLYKDFPDVDLHFMLGDSGHDTHECGAPDGLPFLQFNPHGPLQRGRHYTPNPKYHKGFAIPLPDSWVGLAMTREALQHYVTCLDSRYGAWQDKASKVIWRGGSTGPRAVSPPARTYADWLLHNSRVRMSLFLQAFDWFDVGLHTIYAHDYCQSERCSPEVLKELESAIIKPGVNLEDWAKYKVSISIDGHGSPYRLPQQLMLGTVVLSVASPHKPWFTPAFKPGVHYIPVARDLHNLVVTAKRALVDSNRTSAAIAAAARRQALEWFNIVGHLDAFMWSVLSVKSVQRWAVQPAPDEGWEQLHVHKHTWLAEGLPTALVGRLQVEPPKHKKGWWGR